MNVRQSYHIEKLTDLSAQKTYLARIARERDESSVLHDHRASESCRGQLHWEYTTDEKVREYTP